MSHHVCAVGKFANVGAAVIWNFGLSSYKTNTYFPNILKCQNTQSHLKSPVW